MKHSFLVVLLLLAFSGWGAPARAEKADRNKPMNVEADALRYDDLKQTSVFTGRVVLTKGTILIRGARIDVRQDPDGYQYGVVTAEPGKLAFYRQKREGLDEFIEGEGETIDYDGKADRVKFISTPNCAAYRGSTLTDEIVGSLITYDNSSDTFAVDGGPASSDAGWAGEGGAVAARPGLGAGCEPTKPAVAPVALRPSLTLDGVKK